MTMTATPRRCGARLWPRRDAAGWLGLAAAPTFALMAWSAATDAAAPALCAGSAEPRTIDPMTSMYLLMSLFHASPWLRFVSARAAPPRLPSLTTGD